MNNLGALLAKLKRVKEGCRELDADIYESFGYDVIRAAEKPSGYAWRYGNDEYGYRSWWSMRHLTTSLDAALTLMPKNYAIERFIIWPGHPAVIRILETEQGKDGKWYHRRPMNQFDGEGATPALALCIVALKAYAASQSP